MAEEQKKDKKKVLTAALAAGLAIALAVGGGTYAYLADSTDTAVNTIAMNKALVTLTEPNKPEDGYKIIPGTSQTKDPTITVDATVESYVYVVVEDKTDGLVTYSVRDEWTKLDGYENVYYRLADANKDGESQEFKFLKDDTIYYPSTIVNSNLTDKDGNLKDDVTLSFTAYVIQKSGFATAADGYSEILNPTTPTE